MPSKGCLTEALYSPYADLWNCWIYFLLAFALGGAGGVGAYDSHCSFIAWFWLCALRGCFGTQLSKSYTHQSIVLAAGVWKLANRAMV